MARQEGGTCGEPLTALNEPPPAPKTTLLTRKLFTVHSEQLSPETLAPRPRHQETSPARPRMTPGVAARLKREARCAVTSSSLALRRILSSSPGAASPGTKTKAPVLNRVATLQLLSSTKTSTKDTSVVEATLVWASPSTTSLMRLRPSKVQKSRKSSGSA